MKRITIMLVMLLSLLISCDIMQVDGALNRISARVLSDLLLDADRFLVAVVAEPTTFTTLFGFDPDQAEQAGFSFQAVDCVSETEPSVDSDNDGVPLNFSYTVNCTLTNDNDGSSLSLIGGSNVRDNDDNDPKSGYVIDVDAFKLTFINAQQQESYLILDLDVAISKQAAAYTMSYNFQFASKEVNKPEESISYAYNAGYTPDDANLPFAAGTFDFGGSIQFQGQTSSYTLNGFTDDLHYRDTCALGFDGGSRQYTDSNDNDLRFVYQACGDVDVSFNGIKL